MSQSRDLRINFLFRFLTIMAVCGSLYAGYIFITIKNQRESELDLNSELLNTIGQSIQAELNYLSRDLQEILDSKQLNQFVRSESSDNQRALENYFALLARVSRRYDQIRFLSPDGFEKIRVNYRDNAHTVVAPDKRQNKSNRYYFKEALSLPKDVSFVSSLDLNQEQGVIEKPHKPTIRLAHKIYNAQDKLRGVLVLNYLAQPVITELEIAAGLPGKLTLVDEQGYWVYDEKNQRNWSRQLSSAAKLGDVNPQLWLQLQSIDTNSVFAAVTARRMNYPMTTEAVRVIKPRSLFLIAELPRRPFLSSLYNATMKPIPILALVVIAFLSFVWSLATVREQQALATMKIESERSKQILHTSLVAMVVIDQHGEITEFNRAAEKLFGYTSHEVLSQNVKMLMPEPDRSQHDFYLQRFALSGLSSILDKSRRVVGLHKNGEKVPVELSVSQTSSDGELFFIGNLRDLRTEEALREEQKNAAVQQEMKERLELAVEQRTLDLAVANEQLIEQRDKAETAARAKSEFLANMSHEIRTPLNAIIGMSQMLGRSELTPEIRRISDRMSSAGNSLLSMISDILDISRLGANKLILDSVQFDLNQFLQNVASIMHSSSTNNQLEVTVRTNFQIDYLVVGDESRLQQVLINLVGNAIKFTPQGFVQLEVTMVSESLESIELEFQVKDSGIGISKENQKVIFEAFEQGGGEVHTQFGGSGLGLAISSAILELMGSKLSLQSSLGKGSIFSFIVSLKRGEELVSDNPIPEDLNVLVADDQEIARAAVSAVVNSIGWTAHFVSSGNEALSKLLSSETKVDMVLLDWDMPDLDGLTVAKRIKEHSPKHDAPLIIMVSAVGAEKIRQSPDYDYVDLVLEKPVTPSQLFDAFMKLTAPKITASPRVEQPLQSIRILVADDNEFNREVAVSLFELEGATVHAVSDGQDAVDYLREHPNTIDLVLMDVQMPNLNGYDATKLIRNDLGLNIPIVALTAGAFDHQRKAALDAGMDDFLAKPFNVDHGVNTITRLVNRSTAAESPNHEHQSTQQDLDLFSEQEARKYWPEEARLRVFLKRFQTEHAETITTLQTMDLRSTRQSIHKLKGTASVLGMPRLTVLTEALLRDSEDTNEESISQAQRQQLLEVFNATCAEVSQYLEKD